MILRDKKYWPSVAATLAAVFGLWVSTIAPATQAQGNPNPTVTPPTARPYGLSYGQWSARWWQFVFSIPAADNPQLHDDKCEVGQSGPVWFLTGKFCVEESCQSFLSATRSCTIPAGKALFFPVANSWVDNLGVDPPLSTEQLRELAKEFQDAVTSMSCAVDGVPIRGLSNTSAYRVVSPVFDYTIPEDNLFTAFGYNFPAQTVEGAVADGVYLMLAPLSAGQHVIRFAATFNYGFAFDITYNITVAP